MCLRVDGCCGVSLRRWAMIIAVFTILETLGFIIGGGYFLHRGLKANDYGGPTGYTRQPHRITFDLAFGSLYLAFGALWVVERALYMIPWLVLQAITMGLTIADILSNVVSIKAWGYFGLIPVIFLFVFFYVLVFSYYLELQEDPSDYSHTNHFTASKALILALLILSGFYLHDGVGYKYVGLYEGYDEKAVSSVYGSIFLGMAALWILTTVALFLGIYSSTPYLILPYLVLQVLSMLMASFSIVERMYIALDEMSFVAVPFVLFGIPQFIGVYSYFMDLMEAKVNNEIINKPMTYYN
uniref:Uncharacterized protein n=1 Tax=Strigamia maritima TaxID=126957 RepID=T1J9N3_STRMM